MPESRMSSAGRDRAHTKGERSESQAVDRRRQAADGKDPERERLTNDLWQYGWRCLRKWMKEGTIAARCKANNVPLTCFDSEVQELRRNSYLREDLAAAAVAEAVQYFVDVSKPRGYWKPHKGASMRTYFMHDCLYRF
ncbi:hypothetical protein [Streptomyces sp. NBC_00005]|uniref:hypothetical protein n=1 Tax=Streptomyces sp. NBC_00005 TaxID=2903609 RepID=UPI00325534DB